ncbi:hypothetical protein GCM10025734_04840 [Kitasatospora paranensis]
MLDRRALRYPSGRLRAAPAGSASWHEATSAATAGAPQDRAMTTGCTTGLCAARGGWAPRCRRSVCGHVRGRVCGRAEAVPCGGPAPPPPTAVRLSARQKQTGKG